MKYLYKQWQVKFTSHMMTNLFIFISQFLQEIILRVRIIWLEEDSSSFQPYLISYVYVIRHMSKQSQYHNKIPYNKKIRVIDTHF